MIGPTVAVGVAVGAAVCVGALVAVVGVVVGVAVVAGTAPVFLPWHDTKADPIRNSVSIPVTARFITTLFHSVRYLAPGARSPLARCERG